jgi:hypothetical protein
MPRPLLEALGSLGLLARPERPSPGPASLRALCAAGALDGGLSVALDVRADEVVGALCQRMGGEAPRLRILDVRVAPAELRVRVGEGEARWPVPNVRALVTHLNRHYRHASGVRAIAVLGEWEEAQQLWCIPRSALAPLRAEHLLQVDNARELAALEEAG